MTNTFIDNPEAQGPPLEHVTVEILDDIGLDMGSELVRRERWLATGECTGPTHIGSIRLSESAIATLEADMTEEFAVYLDHGTVTEAHLVPDEDDYKAPSPESLAIMNELQTGFEKIVRQDIKGSVESDSLEIWNPKMTIGLYQEQDDVHIDDALPNEVDVRYLVTVVGPTTTFFTGEFRPSEFDNGSLLKETQVPETAVPTPQPTCVVLRFLTDCDPHDVPIVENPTFRILCDATVKNRHSLSEIK